MGERRKRQAPEDEAEAASHSDNDAPNKKPRKETNASARRSLFVRSLPSTVTSEALTKLFSDTYPLKHATVVLDPETKQSKGYGFVTFADADDAERAKEEFHGKSFQGRKLKVEVAEPRHRDVDSGKGGSGKKTSTLSAEAAETKAARVAKMTEDSKPPKLIIRNLPWSIKEPKDLEVLFQKFGKIKHVTLPKKKDTQAGFGFIVMRGKKNAEKAMEAITESVNLAKADLGIIFDTDVDRAGAVLSDGSELNRNRIIAMLAAILLREHPGTTIVTDSITSTGLAKFIEEKGGVHHRFKRGYRNVINESIRLNGLGQDSQLAIETSGHGAFKENYFLDDGAYIVTKLLIELARGKKEGYTLESMIASLEEPAESVEFRMNIKLEDFKAYGQQVIDELTAFAATKEGWSLAPSNFEGVRVNLDEAHGNGWFLLRLSLHDPLLPLNIESNSQGGAKMIAKELAGFIKGYDKLDAEKFLAYAG